LSAWASKLAEATAQFVMVDWKGTAVTRETMSDVEVTYAPPEQLESVILPILDKTDNVLYAPPLAALLYHKPTPPA
jgi:hypothetical protein